MLIELPLPISLKLSVEEIEDHLPSFRVDLSFQVEQQSSVLTYKNNDIWFECSSWDSFLKKLSSNLKSTDEATLVDMGEKFSLSIVNRENQFFFLVKVAKKSTLSGDLLFSYQIKIDEDMLAKYKDTFNDFPAWW